MYEGFGTILNRGFNGWVRNLNLCIPFILNFIVKLILYFFFFGLMGILLFTSDVGGIIDPASVPAEKVYSMIWEGFVNNIAMIIFVIVIFMVLGIFVQAFFTAGAIGMAQKISETGDTFLADMLISGSRNISRLFFMSLLLALLLFIGIIFTLPGVLLTGDLSEIYQNPAAAGEGLKILGIGMMIWGVYLITLNLIFSLAPYALVIDELSPLEALKKSIDFFLANKLEVFLIWITFIGLTLISSFIGEIIASGNGLLAGITYLVPIIVLQPLVTIFWTRLYLNRSGKRLYRPLYLLEEPS